MSRFPGLISLQNVFFNEEGALEFLQDEGILPKEKECEACGGPTILLKPKLMFRCRKKNCRKGYAVRKGTFFANKCLPLDEILLLGYLWLLKTPVTTLIIQCGLSSATVDSYLGYFRQLVSDSSNEENLEIVDNRTVEENNETEVDKRKHGTKKDMDERQWELAWRRANKKNLWSAFLKALRDVPYT
uniref:DDE_Tnp_IS1595 domain-containing protein n=1 Tax=Strongyloides papillosus TaxID=174720 RepID=A0A0N5B2A9_STREA